MQLKSSLRVRLFVVKDLFIFYNKYGKKDFFMEEKTFDRYSIWFGNVICFDRRNYHLKASRNVLFQMNGDNFIDIFYLIGKF